MGARSFWMMIVLATASSAVAQEAKSHRDYSGNYLCQMTSAGGLKFDEASKSWIGVQFNDVTQTIAVQVEAVFDMVPNSTYKIAIGDSADKELEYCKSTLTSEINIMSFDGQMTCHDVTYAYAMNLNTMRFQYYSAGSYTSNDQAGAVRNPSVVVGVCHKAE